MNWRKLLHALVSVSVTLGSAYAGSGGKYAGIVGVVIAGLVTAGIINTTSAYNTIPPKP